MRNLGLFFERAGRYLQGLGQKKEIWIDVGAHLGERTMRVAKSNPKTTVYAFEPNVKLALRMAGRLKNFIVLPYAIAEHSGVAQFYEANDDATSSLLAFANDGLKTWQGCETLKTTHVHTVPTLRLDDFMDRAGISHVDYMKIDAQGADLSVIRSLGHRIAQVKIIMLEVSIAPVALYEGACMKKDVLEYMSRNDFILTSTSKQTFDQEENITFVNKVFRNKLNLGSC